MRLSKIKLAGFKSFVDPTTIHLNRSRVAIVGPNGCGKSNTIDAVRWVMGESSAKYLRGESMEDVIFNGSSARKPVGQASVELVFDNSDASLGGQFAQYGEISVKRVVSRDGQSQYFLNGSRCRRRDITDLFLGTGLGPRSYAIIEQGMISRLIEAKPEELRVYLEEAAGISKYKERRRETENRIRHTRENLDRLNDLRDELGKRIAHLKRQAQTAERYKALKKTRNRLRAELITLRLEVLETDLGQGQTSIDEVQDKLEAAITRLRDRENEIAKAREQLRVSNADFSEAQSRFYRIGSEITRTEQTIKHAETLRQQRAQALQQIESQRVQASKMLNKDEATLARLFVTLKEREPGLEAAAKAEAEALRGLDKCEGEMSEWQNAWNEFNQRATEPAKRAEVERIRIDHLELQIARTKKNLQRLRDEASTLNTATLEKEIQSLQIAVDQARKELQQAQSSLEATQRSLEKDKNQERELSRRLDAARRELQGLNGRLASLEALQESALGKHDEHPWLVAQNLDKAPRLGECLQVEKGWERAVEAALGAHLRAVCVDDLESLLPALAQDKAPRHFIVKGEEAITADEWDTHVKSSYPVAEFLVGIHVANTLEEALDARNTLSSGEFFITTQGERVGRTWLSLSEEEETQGGILARGEEIERLRRQCAQLEDEIADLNARQDHARDLLRQHETTRTQQQNQVNLSHRRLATDEARLQSLRGQVQRQRQRADAIHQDIEEVERRMSEELEALAQASSNRDLALIEMERLSEERERLEARRKKLLENLDEARRRVQDKRNAHHRIEIILEGLRAELAAAKQAVDRDRAQVAELEERIHRLGSEDVQEAMPTAKLQEELAELLEQRKRADEEMAQARILVEKLETHLREADRSRMELEREAEYLREQLNDRRLAQESLRVRHQTLSEKFAETGFDFASLSQERPKQASIEGWESEIANVERQIQRLGAVNLAAIDEYRTQSERAEYLEAQFIDLTEALSTLESAIAKIDRETRNRFRETFEHVNKRLQDMFPRLFGGGAARLEMTGNDVLTTGVAVLARPPGKRLSTINLMSGGEKALTAVALVFAIFELNPAPFCMLDEVDAPLDEANVGRFIQLVKEMAERVQFIMITHNKVSMESAEHLIGVTMREAGVSRLVAVDIDAAAKMAMS